MENYKLIHPSHLNHYGFLFGGNMLKWVDEYAYIAACADFPNERFVTIAMDNLVFKKSVHAGDIIMFKVVLARRGTTSAHYDVSVHRARPSSEGSLEGERIFATRVSYVCVDEYGAKKPLSADS